MQLLLIFHILENLVIILLLLAIFGLGLRIVPYWGWKLSVWRQLTLIYIAFHLEAVQTMVSKEHLLSDR